MQRRDKKQQVRRDSTRLKEPWFAGFITNKTYAFPRKKTSALKHEKREETRNEPRRKAVFPRGVFDEPKAP